MQHLQNLIGGSWKTPRDGVYQDLTNPASGETVARVPLSTASDVDDAVQEANKAFAGWRATPVTERIQYLFRLKVLLEEHIDDLARTITVECGKTLAEAKGELRRGIENVEVACGMPLMMQGINNEDIAPGIDEHMFRQPLGVVAAITPFNFPGMIPLWFLPYAIACGNCFVLKPSEKTPATAVQLVELIEKAGLPPGVVTLVLGQKAAVDALVQHPEVRAISFVGSTPVARYVYREATAHGKRAQCQGGAKNPLIVLPDADLEMTTQIATDSAFGCAGQRCLAASLAITVGDATGAFKESICEKAAARVVGSGLDDGTEMGPVITPESRERIAGLIGLGESAGANVIVDGRQGTVTGHERGNFLFPTVVENVEPGSELAKTEVFGPVLSLIAVADIDEAIQLLNGGEYGNMACVFTSSGAAARKFRYEAIAGNIGINLGVAAPMAFFPFSGWKESFFGDLHAQGRHGVEFYTQTKIVVERWPETWSRRF
jgi:malonate-semialdehyde dehydrogenase (acetylating)/methylmalonate-semialdehyde dehydrogenase